DAFLFHRIAVSDSDRPPVGRIVFTKGVEVHRDAERGSDLVLTTIATADRSPVVVEDVHPGLERLLDLPGNADLLLVLLQQGEDSDLDRRHPRHKAEHRADVFLALL